MYLPFSMLSRAEAEGICHARHVRVLWLSATWTARDMSGQMRGDTGDSVWMWSDDLMVPGL